MNTSMNDLAWLADSTVHDLIQRFPLPIALLDDAGGALVLNDRFGRNYAPETLASAPLQDLMRNPVPGWHTVRVPNLGQGEVEIKAQVLSVQGTPMLILDDATDPGLLRELDQLHGQITELERISSTDRLTGAWNRHHLDRVVAAELDRSIRSRQPVSLVLFDIDHFKLVNDTYGHQTGDSVLCELVKVIGGAIRSVDTLFRWGGEEFVVLASSTGYRAGTTLAEKLRGKVAQHGFAGVGRVTISLGVAEHIATESAEIWFGRVDQALYRAKNGGRNRTCVDEHGSSDIWAGESGPSVIRLVWQEAYECGEPAIDREHRELFELANALLDASFKSESAPEVFGAALQKLLAHIVQHFAHEEALLARHGYEQLEPHRRAHAGLLARAGELKAAVEAGKTTLGDLVDFLATTVVAQHLFKADKEYFPLFKK
ncbi:MAG: diguanylate cyclase/phosphodiesterase (GGDEF & EAL domains) with PAS/PAC sensor(s) [Rhodocyclaceae bacterium]|nr:MAG: diguanylate cyclase/phosphodiesterase (GGDEF & EAL domains) with PAS/PAC sensor(s) [Rhodocyclaceae bacterium]TND00152.1 MAG: diguanylate cyclase/phosphodiesterase (GGDEF & EAL domains) with PAS/PAC sensor(s) [Rhodocyclaceae bacterium]